MSEQTETTTINVALPTDLHRELRIAALASGKTMIVAVHEAIALWIDHLSATTRARKRSR